MSENEPPDTDPESDPEPSIWRPEFIAESRAIIERLVGQDPDGITKLVLACWEESRRLEHDLILAAMRICELEAENAPGPNDTGSTSGPPEPHATWGRPSPYRPPGRKS